MNIVNKLGLSCLCLVGGIVAGVLTFFIFGPGQAPFSVGVGAFVVGLSMVWFPGKTEENEAGKPKKHTVKRSVNVEPHEAVRERQLVENIDVQETAERHEVSEATIRKWLNEGELEGYKDGNHWVIPVYSDEILSVKEASEIFGASPAKIRNWLNDGLIAGYKDEQNRWCVYAPDE